jgi:dGTPase
MVDDVLEESGRRILRLAPGSAKEVRDLSEPLIGFGGQMVEKNRTLQSFLSQRMYRHARVLEIMTRAQRVIRDLFTAYLEEPKLLPVEWREDQIADDRSRFARQVCDFIAGMTDRYALDQHKRLFDLDPLFR